jgi:hypothetical protein
MNVPDIDIMREIINVDTPKKQYRKQLKKLKEMGN